METRGARVARGTIAALVASFIAGFFHMIADGCPPSVFGLLLALAFAIPTCVLLAGKTLSRTRLSIAVAASQAVFHGTMNLGEFTAAATADAPLLGAHAHGTAVSLVSPASAASAASHADHDPGMWFAHFAAAILTIWMLRRGEMTFWALVQRTCLAVASALLTVGLPPITRTRGAVPPVIGSDVRPRLVNLSSMRHRGPPVVL